MSAGGGPLVARIARLEQIVSQLQGQAGGGEALSPNFLTVTPAGQVGASFTGLVNALGLVLPTGAVLTPPSINRIIWQRASDGADTADISAVENSGLSILQLNTYADAPDTATEILLLARDPSLGASLEVVAGGASNEFIRANVGSRNVQIIGQDGSSNFVQIASDAVAIDRFGGINPNGTINTAGSGDWTATRNAVGDYTVGYNASGAGNGNIVNVTVVKGSGFVLAPELVVVNPTGFQVQFFDPGAVQRDTTWFFRSITN